MRFSFVAAGLALLLVSGMAWAAGEEEAAASERVTITYMRSEHPSSPIHTDAPVYEAIREALNIDLQIEAIPGGDFNAKVQLLLGTAQLPDIARLRQRQVNDFADSGVFLPLNEPLKNQAPDLWAYIDAIPDAKKTFIDGTMYYVPQMDSFQKLLAPIPMIRRDLLDDTGQEMPDSFDELYETLATFKREYPDSQPWTVRGGTRNLLNRAAFPMGMGWSIHWQPGEQRWVYGTVKPEFKAILEYFRNAYVDGVLDPDFAINSSSQWHEKLGSGKSLFYYDNMTFGLNYTLSLRQVKPDALFWPVPVMENSFGSRQNFSYPRHWLSSGFTVGRQEQAPRPHHGAVQLDGPRRRPAHYQLGPRGRALAPRQRESASRSSWAVSSAPRSSTWRAPGAPDPGRGGRSTGRSRGGTPTTAGASGRAGLYPGTRQPAPFPQGDVSVLHAELRQRRRSSTGELPVDRRQLAHQDAG